MIAPHIDHDVLIVGAGPTGMTAALALAQKGKSVRIIDKHAGRLAYSRAILVNSASLRIMDDLGLASSIAEASLSLTGVEFHDGARRILSAAFPQNQGRPSAVLLPQLRTEQCMEAALARAGIVIERPLALTDFTQDAQGVCARLSEGADGVANGGTETTMRARYLIGADGYHSTVRARLGVPYNGADLPNPLLCLDIRTPHWPFAAEAVFKRHSQGFIAVFRMTRDSARIVCTNPAQADDAVRWLGGTPRDVLWQSLFQVHFATAERYGEGRVWLAGDAAHVHSPLGGRGMNMGIMDGMALAGAICSGDFQAFEAERRSAAHSWVERNRKLTELVCDQRLPARVVKSALLWGLRLAGLINPQATARALIRQIASVEVGTA